MNTSRLVILLIFLDAKGDLIKKALGTEELPIEITEDAITFPWFETLPDVDTAKTYTRFVSKLCEMSKKQKRINNTENKVENENTLSDAFY